MALNDPRASEEFTSSCLHLIQTQRLLSVMIVKLSMKILSNGFHFTEAVRAPRNSSIMTSA